MALKLYFARWYSAWHGGRAHILADCESEACDILNKRLSKTKCARCGKIINDGCGCPFPYKYAGFEIEEEPIEKGIFDFDDGDE